MTIRPYSFTASPSASECSVEIHRLKREYDRHLKRAKGLSDKTAEHRLSAIDKLALFLGDTPVKGFSSRIAIEYVDHMVDYENPRTGKKRDLKTISSELNRLKDFLTWLHSQPGYKSRITHDDVAY